MDAEWDIPLVGGYFFRSLIMTSIALGMIAVGLIAIVTAISFIVGPQWALLVGGILFVALGFFYMFGWGD